MAGHGNGDGMITGINVTPLVDITLVLLIIFIVTAKILVTPAVPLDLPQAARSEEVQLVLSVIVPKSGGMMVNGEPVKGDAEMLARLKRGLAEDAHVRAVIQADGSVPHRQMIHVLDLVKRAGVEKVAFAATPLDETAP